MTKVFEIVKYKALTSVTDEEILDELVAQEGQRELMKKIIEY